MGDDARTAPLATLLDAFDSQIGWCLQPAPFTARVLQRSRLWLARDADAHAAFAAVAADPRAAAVPLRWAGALHHLALRGLQPWASRWTAGPGTAADDDAFDRALDDAITGAWLTQRAHCDAALALPPQTNEVQRSVALLPGLLHIAARTGLPVRLLEIGASAGLNLWCDRYRHVWGEVAAWGDDAAALTLRCDWTGPAPAVDAPLRITQRAGCDAKPIDLRQPGEALRLASFIWPDQPERLARLRVASAEAARCLAFEGVVVEALPAAQFVQRELHQRRDDETTVLMHSVVWQYIAADEQMAIRSAVEAAGARATAAAPLAWLRFEPELAAPAGSATMALRCRLWPDGSDLLLARCHPHGAQVEWLHDGSA